MLGIDFVAAEFGGAAGGALQNLLGVRAQVFSEARTAAASAAAPGTDRDGCASRSGRRGRLGVIASAGPAAEEIVVEEILERAAASAEQRFQRRTRTLLLARQTSVVDIAKFKDFALAVAGDTCANRGGPHVAYVANPVGHGTLLALSGRSGRTECSRVDRYWEAISPTHGCAFPGVLRPRLNFSTRPSWRTCFRWMVTSSRGGEVPWRRCRARGPAGSKRRAGGGEPAASGALLASSRFADILTMSQRSSCAFYARHVNELRA